ncbi:MAG: hypothetical protein M9894_04535 [Planctomycetes bacterium]|nr:hypothetical protein [Planctomycetota bacterium]
MAEREADRGERRRLRCPYCHDALPEGALHERVTCGACGAEHHAECAVEGGGCSATGCAGKDMAVGATLLRLDDLAQVARDPARMERLARPRRWPVVAHTALTWVRGGLALLTVCLPVAGALDPLTALALAVLVFVGLTALGALILPPRRNRRDPHQERELMASLGLAVPDPMAPILAEMRRETASGPAPVVTGPRPTRCPACGAALDAEEAEDDGAWFCHHCGASLGDEPEKG